MTKEQLAEEYLDSKYHPVSQQRDNARKAYLAGFEAAERKWKLCSEHQPMCYRKRHWDGKKSDNYLLEDKYGKQYIACAYEIIYRGETYFEWYDNNDFSIDYPFKFIEIPD